MNLDTSATYDPSCIIFCLSVTLPLSLSLSLSILYTLLRNLFSNTQNPRFFAKVMYQVSPQNEQNKITGFVHFTFYRDETRDDHERHGKKDLYINQQDAQNSVIRLYFPLDALHVSDYISPSSGVTFYKLYIAFGICRYHTSGFCVVPAYTKWNVQLIKLLLMMD